MSESGSTEQCFAPRSSDTPIPQLDYLQIALRICGASQNTPSVRDTCRFIYNRLESIIPINRLFCAVRTETGGVRFLALIDNGESRYGLYDRELSENEPLTRVFEQGKVLLSRGYQASEELLSPELREARSWVLTPLMSSVRQVAGAIGACSDQPVVFSEVELSLLRTSAEAVMVVVARTAIIDRIISTEQERIMAEAAGDLLHDITNLLGPIATYAVMIEQMVGDEFPPECKRYLQEIKSQAMEVQIACQSKLSEIKNRIARPKVARTDVVELLDSARTASESGQFDVQFRSEIDHSVPRVLVRHRDLFEVLREIIRNGIWAMRDSGEKTITLRARPWNDPDSGVWAVIEIEDTGCGIPESDLDRIWELTYSTKSSSGGYGLYRAKSVIEDFGGHIGVRSQVDAGTTFEIKLPGEIKPGAGSPLL